MSSELPVALCHACGEAFVNQGGESDSDVIQRAIDHDCPHENRSVKIAPGRYTAPANIPDGTTIEGS